MGRVGPLPAAGLEQPQILGPPQDLLQEPLLGLAGLTATIAVVLAILVSQSLFALYHLPNLVMGNGGKVGTTTGEIAVALVNLDAHKATPITLSIAGAKVRTVKGEILTAAALDAHNTFESPDAVKPSRFNGARLKDGRLSVALPAKSVVVLSLQ